MTKETNNRSYSSFADLAKAIGTTPAELRRQYLDKAIADNMRTDDEAGTAATPDELDELARQAEIADMIAQDGVSDSFALAFGNVTALSILEMGADRQELDMPEAAEAQAECHAIVNTIFDLFRDTRLARLIHQRGAEGLAGVA